MAEPTNLSAGQAKARIEKHKKAWEEATWHEEAKRAEFASLSSELHAAGSRLDAVQRKKEQIQAQLPAFNVGAADQMTVVKMHAFQFLRSKVNECVRNEKQAKRDIAALKDKLEHAKQEAERATKDVNTHRSAHDELARQHGHAALAVASERFNKAQHHQASVKRELEDLTKLLASETHILETAAMDNHLGYSKRLKEVQQVAYRLGGEVIRKRREKSLADEGVEAARAYCRDIEQLKH